MSMETSIAQSEAMAPEATQGVRLVYRSVVLLTRTGYVAATVGFAATMLLGIIFRYVLNHSLSWSDELSMLLFSWATFFAVSSAYFQDRHIAIDFFTSRLSPYGRVYAHFFREIFSGVFLLVMLISSIEAVPFFERNFSDALRIPRVLFLAPIILSAVSMIVHWTFGNLGKGRWSTGLLKLTIVGVLFALLYIPIGGGIRFTGTWQLLFVTVSFLLPLVLGTPVAFALGLAASCYLAAATSIPFSTGALQMFAGVEIYALLAVPLLILSGKIMHATGVAKCLVDLAQVLVGKIRGGLGVANVVASYLFGDISGSAVSDTAAIGSLMIPEMIKRGYRSDFCAALQGAGGTLGLTAPLSITLILYGAATNTSVARLATATILPALMVAASFILVVITHARRHRYRTEHGESPDRAKTLLAATPGLAVVVMIVGGILSGAFTPAEVGTILVIYVLLLAAFFYRRMSTQQYFQALMEAGHISGMTLFMTSTSAFLGFMLIRDGIPADLVEAVSALSANKYFILLFANVTFVILAMILEPPAIIFGFMPIMMPLLSHARIDPVHFGVLFVVNLGIGMLIPPIGLNLFIATAIANESLSRVVRAAAPFYLILVVDLVIIVLIPQVALLLPRLVFG
jgi:C4-dicarboxylate transporter, DctM subunit